MVAILVVLTIVVAVAIDALIVARRRHAEGTLPQVWHGMAEPRPPQGIFLDAAHSWARITSDGSLRVGIDEFLAEAIGDVERVELPPRGTQVRRGDPLLRLRVKGREIVVPSPVSGEILGRNDQVAERPWLVARDPYGVGWMLAVWARDLQEAIRPLRVGAGVVGYLRQEMARLADFLTAPALRTAALPVLADGGVPRQGALADLDDAAWDAFQNEFLAPAREV